MKKNIEFEQARDLLLGRLEPVGSEVVPLSEAGGRILSEDIRAQTDIPSFPRSPYDGYAFRAADSLGASRENPVTLKVLEEISAGILPGHKIVPGTAAKILTGAPIPEGADAVVMYEITEFTENEVRIFFPASPGLAIVPIGEDFQAGALIAVRGDRVDPALAGSLAAQGLAGIPVYKKPKAGIISTGNELVEIDQPVFGATIRNSNRYLLEAALRAAGLEPVYLGQAKDEAAAIAALMSRGLAECDIIFSSGGVSVGDYDLTPAGLELVGAEILVRGLRLKPGGACAYAVKDGKLILGLSGNPSSAMTNFYAVALPCLRRLCGYSSVTLPQTKVILRDSFNKKSPNTRLISGQLDLSDGVVRMSASIIQGHAILRTLIGCDVMAVIPAGSPPLPAGTALDAFILR